MKIWTQWTNNELNQSISQKFQTLMWKRIGETVLVGLFVPELPSILQDCRNTVFLNDYCWTLNTRKVGIRPVCYQITLKVTQEEQIRKTIFEISYRTYWCVTSMYMENDILNHLIHNMFLSFPLSAKSQTPPTFIKHLTFGYAECNKHRPLINGPSVDASLDINTFLL